MLVVLEYSTNEVLSEGMDLINLSERRKNHWSTKSLIQQFKVHFGSHPRVYKYIFIDLQRSTNPDARIEPGRVKIKYFLMALYFLRLYPTQLEMVVTFDRCRETIDDWLWYYLRRLQALKDEVIVWPEEWGNPNNPFIPYHIGTVDGVHCMTYERQTAKYNRDKQCCSHKFKGPGLTYEVCMDLWECRMIHIRRPGKAGKNDKTVFRESLMGKIPAGSKVIADNGYMADDLREVLAFSTTEHPRHIRRMYGRAKARHESLYSRMKNFDVLSERFRCKHADRDAKHKTCFECVAIIVQYQFDCGSPLFTVDHLETI
jgi:hypothetical protein